RAVTRDSAETISRAAEKMIRRPITCAPFWHAARRAWRPGSLPSRKTRPDRRARGWPCVQPPAVLRIGRAHFLLTLVPSEECGPAISIWVAACLSREWAGEHAQQQAEPLPQCIA